MLPLAPALLAALLALPARAGDAPVDPWRRLPRYRALEAAEHVGEEAVVCGLVSSAKYVEDARGRPTFLNLDRPWPRHVFTVVIWEDARARFERPPELAYHSQAICVRGRIRTHDGLPQVQVYGPEQVLLEDELPPPVHAPSVEPEVPASPAPLLLDDDSEPEVDVAYPPVFLDLGDEGEGGGD